MYVGLKEVVRACLKKYIRIRLYELRKISKLHTDILYGVWSLEYVGMSIEVRLVFIRMKTINLATIKACQCDCIYEIKLINSMKESP